MGYNPIEVNQAAKKAARMLGESGAAGRAETKRTEILAEQALDFVTAEHVPYPYALIQPPAIVFTEGEKYIAYFDGVRYECTCFSLDGVLAIGNTKFANADDTGVPFVVADLSAVIGTTQVMCDTTGTHTIAIYQETETIHTIDPKFIPAGVGGGLPVVEITTQPTEEGAVLTAEESAMLDEAAAKGLPIVVKMPVPLPYGEAQVAQVFYFQTVLHLTSFLSATAVAASFYAFEYDGEEWLFIKAAE